jgi:hypothetical protein
VVVVVKALLVQPQQLILLVQMEVLESKTV